MDQIAGRDENKTSGGDASKNLLEIIDIFVSVFVCIWVILRVTILVSSSTVSHNYPIVVKVEVARPVLCMAFL